MASFQGLLTPIRIVIPFKDNKAPQLNFSSSYFITRINSNCILEFNAGFFANPTQVRCDSNKNCWCHFRPTIIALACSIFGVFNETRHANKLLRV